MTRYMTGEAERAREAGYPMGFSRIAMLEEEARSLVESPDKLMIYSDYLREQGFPEYIAEKIQALASRQDFADLPFEYKCNFGGIYPCGEDELALLQDKGKPFSQIGG